ncbi:FAD-binding protein [Cryobacterium mannosilyticum]|uniref:FAD-binding protein n=1 Tax=Cryobacterium mannosilyticum TaxID=1259190 RepID=UPI001F547F90|nr:NAD(P)/FAD-dependent oxidoreductase [Cryobacterium mannosilyticum]
MTRFLKTQHDVIIIGAGAAGLGAGLVLGRARADVLLIDAASRATRRPHIRTASSPATACRRRSFWPRAAKRSPSMAAQSRPRR